ncbi:MAG: beta-mannosidase [Chloroflexi bacterium]|nr:beta-mannosidase [Chloroflexota bacterium]
MFDRWKLQDYAPGEGRTAIAFAEEFYDTEWIPADVPGDVHLALIAAGRIPNPFYDRNELECAWIEDREWWYRLQFEAPVEPLQSGERLQLVFHGLDTFVTVWLNGSEIGRHKNMFREAVFDVTSSLRIGQQNTLALCFDRPLDYAGEYLDRPVEDWMPPRVAMRKAQFGYGWDWGPRLPTVGIWRPVELRRQRSAALSGVHFATVEIDQNSSQAVVSCTVEADRFADEAPLSARITLYAPGASVGDPPLLEQTVTLQGSGANQRAVAYAQIANPALWWTHDLGEPALHRLDVALKQQEVTIDSSCTRVGIRTVMLDQAPDQEEPGTRFFRFVLNGVPIFAKGTNWIPADSFVGGIKPERYAQIIRAARDVNNSMLRVWGGGIYEHDAFYDECDALGILVWQDFMFACANYPEDDEFASEVEAEATYQIRRLRNHPCLALWCGNNENQWLHSYRNWDHPDRQVSGFLYYDKTLPRAVAQHDGRTPYWPGSPYGGNDYNSMEDGDRHNWDVWHGNRSRRFGEKLLRDQSPEGVSYVHYAEDMGRFISEFGMHAAPVFETLRRNIPQDELYHHSPSMDHHNKDKPKNKGDNLMQATTGLPRDLDEYIDFSMMAQAEGLKLGIEHFRRRTPHCSGSLVWQLNDCWPVLSWSVLDYYGFGKAGYFYLKRVYAPVLASFKLLEDGRVELWITNDTLQSISESVTVRLGTFSGETDWEANLPISVPALTSAAVHTWDSGSVSCGADQYIAVRSATNLFPQNRAFFTAIKDLRREAGEVDVATTAVDANTVEVRLAAKNFAYFVHLAVPQEATTYSDNYFDLLPGEERLITVWNSSVEISPEMVVVRWR